MSPTPQAPGSLLPLKPQVFQILLVLLERDCHGYWIAKEVERRSEAAVDPANLYRTLRNMRDEGLIEESDWRPDPEIDDERRRYFRVTDFGREVARAEATRLADLVGEARSLGLT